MAYALKVLERTTNATVANAVNIPSLFASESTGYAGAGGTAAFDAANHRWTLTGAASRVDSGPSPWVRLGETACRMAP